MAVKAKILIVTDSAVLPTGLAETTRLLFGALNDAYPGAYELHQLGLFHCYAVTQPRWPIYPTSTIKDPNGKLLFADEDSYGQKTFPELVRKLRPDLVFIFGDPQRVCPLCVPATQRSYKLVLYVNFDGTPVPANYATSLSYADRIVTKSEFSTGVLSAALSQVPVSKLGYMYSPADCGRFGPVNPHEKAELRAELFPEWMGHDSFVLGWVGRDQWRKQVWLLHKVLHYLRQGDYLICGDCQQISLFDWDPARQQSLREAGAVLESPPLYGHDCCVHCLSQNVAPANPLRDIYLWCHMADEPQEGWPLRRIEEQWGLRRDCDIFYTPDHGLKSALAPENVPTLYKLWDCLLFLSGGEGFGLPVWEAMCSGIPVVCTNYSAHAELVRRADSGLRVGGILQPDRSCIWRMIADVPQVIAAVRRLYVDRVLSNKLGLNGRAFVQQFRPEVQASRWHEIFQSVLTT